MQPLGGARVHAGVYQCSRSWCLCSRVIDRDVCVLENINIGVGNVRTWERQVAPSEEKKERALFCINYNMSEAATANVTDMVTAHDRVSAYKKHTSPF